MTTITKNNGQRKLPFDEHRLLAFIQSAAHRYPKLDVESYSEKVIRSIDAKEEYSADQISNLLILAALENVSARTPDWTYVAAYVLNRQLYKKASKNRVYDAVNKYGDFYSLLVTLTDKGIYNPKLLETYSKEEINELGTVIDPERDKLFTYFGLFTLSDRYLATDHAKNVYELPQERFLVIAMTLMSQEKNNRINLVKEAYWALSSLYMTVATPTLANAGKTYGQLSSCFIDTIDDSLRGIYDSNTDVARLSKDGGGIGVYAGNIRSRGSDIKGFKGVSSGTVPWIKQLNNTAVSVDQLGQRPGAIAVYQDVWHKDIQAFLDLRLNNGDERQRAHDIFTGVCLPDLFMEQVEKRGDWFLFDPHEVEQVMGFRLQDFYDEEEGAGSFRTKYEECVQSNELSKTKVPAIEIFKRIMISQLETGTPYMFYRDTVNRANQNKHAGMIYCSNLCTEITQNQSPTYVVEETTEGDEIIIRKKAGDFVVCNLSSINLARAVTDGVLEQLIPIQVRMLDNVIDLNTIEVPQARMTNEKYRAVGLGAFGWHHLLALKKIPWLSDDAVKLADELYEDIAYLTIKASADLAKEKGAYKVFEGSEFQTGEYFVRRFYVNHVDDIPEIGEGSGRWNQLAYDIQNNGIRNGYLMSPAPNGSTADIGGSTAASDPVFRLEYSVEKKNAKIPVTAPDLSPGTRDFYSYFRDVRHAKASIAQNAARQRHIDQSQSFNIYVYNDVKAAELLDIHMTAWKNKLKTTYYVRSTSETSEEACENCYS